MSRTGSVRIAAICAAIMLVTLIAFSGSTENSFVNYDDDVYVTSNPHVTAGLTADGILWSIRSTYAANWHPITWISHMLDVEVFGLNAAKHHLMSVLLHVANAVLLFVLLLRLTGAYWRSAFVSGLFALHPLHVESVAWVAERKDVLSTLFWLLTTAAWVRWVESTTPARYVVVLALFALGLMAKPMLVTLPFTLLLLDYWPLRRTRRRPLWKEKVPLFAMSAASSIVTIVAQSRGATVQGLATLPFTVRLANVAVAYVWYLGKMLWPKPLACFYPYPGEPHSLAVVGSVLLLVGVTALAIRLAVRAPYLAFGWAWYLGTLVPVIGLVQVGAQATADRYAYVPLIGVFVAIAWGLAALVDAYPRLRPAIATTSAAALIALIPVTRAQVKTWHDNFTLFGHAIAVTRDNNVAHNNLGLAYLGAGQTDEAVDHFTEAIRIKPDYVQARMNLGTALHRLGRDAEAVGQLRQALTTDPNAPGVHVNLANSLAATGQPDAAIEHYEQALRLQPDLFDAEENLGLLLDLIGRHAEAIPHLDKASRQRPNDANAHLGLGTALAGTGQTDAALQEIDAALRLNPNFPDAYNQKGIVLAGAGRLTEALEQYEHAIRLKPDYAAAINNAGLALAGLNRFPEAIDRFSEAVRVAPAFAQAHNNFGVALARVGRIPEAIAQFEQAVRIDPGFTQARDSLRSLQAAQR